MATLKDTIGCNDHLTNDPALWAAAATLGMKYARIDGNWDTCQPDGDYQLDSLRP
jgi:hypothetical protein